MATFIQILHDVVNGACERRVLQNYGGQVFLGVVTSLWTFHWRYFSADLYIGNCSNSFRQICTRERRFARNREQISKGSLTNNCPITNEIEVGKKEEKMTVLWIMTRSLILFKGQRILSCHTTSAGDV